MMMNDDDICYIYIYVYIYIIIIIIIIIHIYIHVKIDSSTNDFKFGILQFIVSDAME